MTSQSTTAKRVLVVCNDTDYFMRHRLAVVEHLISSGVDVKVIAGGEPLRHSHTRGWSYVHTPINRFAFDPLSDFALWLRSFKTVCAWRPDAVHLITLKPMVFSGTAAIAARLICGRPHRILITIPGLGRMMGQDTRERPSRSKSGRYLTEATARFLARRGGVHFSFETTADRDTWLGRGLASAIQSSVVGGAGVDPRKFFPAQADPSARKIRVLFASRLLRSKGLDTFVDVARRLIAREDVEFLVAGISSPDDPDAVSPSELKRENSVAFLGKVEDMPNLLRTCDIVCLPTRYGEGIPRILIEAAATGLAAIASDLPGCREIIDDGVTGTILSGAHSDAASELEGALRAYLAHPERIRVHGVAARQRFLSGQFDEQTIAQQFKARLGV